MRAVARIVGVAWMALCAVLWLWVGFAQPLGGVAGSGLPWLLPSLLSDSQFGLTFVPLLLGGIGYAIWRWGKGSTDRVQ